MKDNFTQKSNSSVPDADQRQGLSQKEKEAAADKIRNEGIEGTKNEEEQSGQEIDLEIEAPGAASAVAEEGSLTIQNEQEYT